MSSVLLPRFGRGVFRSLIVLAVSGVMLLGAPLAARAADGTGVKSSALVSLRSFSTAMGPDRVYSLYSQTGISAVAEQLVAYSISAGPKISTTKQVLLSSAASGVWASAGRAIGFDPSGNVSLFDRGVRTGSLPKTGYRMKAMSGSWYLSVHDTPTAGIMWMSSIDGTSVNLAQYNTVPPLRS